MKKYGNKKGIDAAHYMTASIHYLKCSTSDRKSQYEVAA
jgi:outer membrane protein assembly factor BamD (BamD/ComL family)